VPDPSIASLEVAQRGSAEMRTRGSSPKNDGVHSVVSFARHRIDGRMKTDTFSLVAFALPGDFPCLLNDFRHLIGKLLQEVRAEVTFLCVVFHGPVVS